MKSGFFAIYHGKEYASGKDKKGKYILRSTDINDLKEGFHKCEPFYFRKSKELIVCYKYVERSEIEEYYSIRTIAMYQGYMFDVIDENENQILIVTMVGDYREWKRLGMQCIDKGVYQKWIDRNETEFITYREIL